MILSPVPPQVLPPLLDQLAGNLEGHPQASLAFARIAATFPVRGGVDTPEQRAQAVALAHAFGLATIPEEPQQAFSWDGHAIRTVTEASVIVHEVAHWLVCAPERRGLPDFGLGAGPETGRRAEADAARCVGDDDREWEEVLTSLLGILWEAELGQPAILAFLEQNWMEGAQRLSTASFFIAAVETLDRMGLVDREGRPVGPRDYCSRASAGLGGLPG